MSPLKNSLAMLVLTGICSISAAQSQTLRDPTLPGVVMPSSQQGSGHSVSSTRLILQSIVRSDLTSNVVINNQVYSLGDKVRGQRIKHIGVDSITFHDGRKLKLFEAVTESVGK